jgi:hypothetical protein
MSETTVSASALRNNIYRLLDTVVATGRTLVVGRKGHRIRISREVAGGKVSRLVKHDCIVGDPEDLVHTDWSKERTRPF